MSNSNSTTVQFPIAGILGVLFIALKLTHVIAWSWVWVLAPFWIPVVLVVVLVGLVFLLQKK